MAYGQILGQTPFPVAQNVEYNGKVSGVDNVKSALDKLNDEVVKAAESGGGVRTAKVVIGAKNGGWTEKDCDYLCDGNNDFSIIAQAVNDISSQGGELFFLSGEYGSETNDLQIKNEKSTNNNITISGNGQNNTIILCKYCELKNITLNNLSISSISGIGIEGKDLINFCSIKAKNSTIVVDAEMDVLNSYIQCDLFSVFGSSCNILNNKFIFDSGGYGLGVAINLNSITIKNNYLSLSSGKDYTLSINDGCSYCNIEGNTIWATNMGIKLSGDHNTVTNNIVLSNYDSMEITNVKFCIVSNNLCADTIHITGSNPGLVTNNIQDANF